MRLSPTSRRRSCGGAPSACSAAWITRERCWGRSSRGGCSRQGVPTYGPSSGRVLCRGWWCWFWQCGLSRMVEDRGGNLHQPSPTSTNLHQPSPASPLLAISFFYLLRMPDTLVILRSQELGVPVAIVPLLWAAVHVVRSSSSFLGGEASDRLGPARTMWA